MSGFAPPPGGHHLYGFSKQNAERIEKAVQAVEGANLGGEPRTKKTRDTVADTGGDSNDELVIVRHIPSMDGILLHVEMAVPHPEFGGVVLEVDEDGNPTEVDTTNLGRYVALSEAQDLAARAAAEANEDDPAELVPVDPVLVPMLTWMHYPAWMYDAFTWAVGAVSEENERANLTTRDADILVARQIRGVYRVELDYRLYTIRVDGSAREGSCFPADAIDG